MRSGVEGLGIVFKVEGAGSFLWLDVPNAIRVEAHVREVCELVEVDRQLDDSARQRS